MRGLDAIEADLDALVESDDARTAARRLLALAEEILENWVLASGREPTSETSEGFRLLALHRQGAKGVPSFNACRETCREVAYHCNLLCGEPGHAQRPARQRMMASLVRHLAYFVDGKMQVEGLGDFCCSSRPLRLESREA